MDLTFALLIGVAALGGVLFVLYRAGLLPGWLAFGVAAAVSLVALVVSRLAGLIGAGAKQRRRASAGPWEDAARRMAGPDQPPPPPTAEERAEFAAQREARYAAEEAGRRQAQAEARHQARVAQERPTWEDVEQLADEEDRRG